MILIWQLVKTNVNKAAWRHGILAKTLENFLTHAKSPWQKYDFLGLLTSPCFILPIQVMNLTRFFKFCLQTSLKGRNAFKNKVQLEQFEKRFG